MMASSSFVQLWSRDGRSIYGPPLLAELIGTCRRHYSTYKHLCTFLYIELRLRTCMYFVRSRSPPYSVSQLHPKPQLTLDNSRRRTAQLQSSSLRPSSPTNSSSVSSHVARHGLWIRFTRRSVSNPRESRATAEEAATNPRNRESQAPADAFPSGRKSSPATSSTPHPKMTLARRSVLPY